MRLFARRLGGSILLVWLVVTLLFLLLRAAPGDPAQLMAPPGASLEDMARIRADMGLDRPLPVQYARWMGNVIKGDLGRSFSHGRPVVAVLAEALPLSIFLGLISLTLTFIVGVAVGLAQAARRGSKLDTTLTVLTTAVFAAPSFWLALALVAIFTYGAAVLGFPYWARLPAFGLFDPAGDLTGVARAVDFARHSVLPIAVLSAIGAAGIARYARSAVADVVRLDFVRTARAKGVARTKVYTRHVLMTVLPALAVLAALSLPGLVSGAVFVESVFAWPGMGRTMLLAIAARDYPLVLGAALAYSTVVIFANLAADLVLPMLDPRRRHE